jgi:flagellin
MRINTNISAVNAQRNLNTTGASLAKSVEKLSSGLRINRAADDAAGLTISEKLRGQVRGLNQAVRNAQDGISMIQTAEGALNETHSILQRMRELAVQASNDTLTTSDQSAIGSELVSLRDEINRIADNTQFNTKALLGGSIGTSIDATSNVLQGAAVGSTGVVVSKLDVSGAKANTTYRMTVGTAANSVRLTNVSTGVSQDVTLSTMTTSGSSSQTLSFGNLGVSMTLSGFGANGTAANLQTALTNSALDEVITAAGAGSAQFQVGANANQTVSLAIDSARSDATNGGTTLGFGNGGGYATLNAAVNAFSGGPSTAIAQNLVLSLDDALADVSASRANLGAVQNRLEHTIENLSVASENLLASESRIRDADMASEMVGFTRSNILQQAGTSILAQANQGPNSILSLLR